jgi:hypothetical protein
MSKIEAGAKPTDSPDWERAWGAVAHLAAARDATLPGVGEPPPVAGEPPAIPLASAPTPTLAAAEAALPPLAGDQLARDIAEIAQAAAALRRAEPSLEPRLPDGEARSELRNVDSVWVLVTLIWLCAASVISCAIGAAVLLFG